MHYVLGAMGMLILAAAWCGPLPNMAGHSFTAHMSLHMAVVALAAPALACAAANTWVDPVRYMPGLFAAVPASVVELLIVWAWHAPVLHHAARNTTWGFAVEQGTFLLAGLWLWLSALGSPNQSRSFELSAIAQRRGAGVLALLLTSMHMTLLGALLALSPRLLFQHHEHSPISGLGSGLSPLVDQQLGGAVMLVVGGAVYLLGGVWLTGELLRVKRTLNTADAS
jgi:putative membrane protein